LVDDSKFITRPTSPAVKINSHKLEIPSELEAQYFPLDLRAVAPVASWEMRVALFVPCFVDQLFPRAAISMVTVLERLGINVDYPMEQTCCGQPAFNTGYWDEARKVATRFIEVFEKTGCDAIVSPSGSCTAMVRVFYKELFQDVEPAFRKRLAMVSENVFEFSEFLTKKLHVTDVGAKFPAKVTFHDACHLLRELRCKDEPRQLLRMVKGLELVEMKECETCCGFGGTFSVKFPSISTAMDDVKIKSIQETGAEYVVACDSSCLMQIDGYLKHQNIPVKIISLAEVLAST
jgi:L-lactate dehydrogenase complex protein LldE